jgi:hypothetical protein
MLARAFLTSSDGYPPLESVRGTRDAQDGALEAEQFDHFLHGVPRRFSDAVCGEKDPAQLVEALHLLRAVLGADRKPAAGERSECHGPKGYRAFESSKAKAGGLFDEVVAECKTRYRGRQQSENPIAQRGDGEHFEQHHHRRDHAIRFKKDADPGRDTQHESGTGESKGSPQYALHSLCLGTNTIEMMIFILSRMKVIS